MSAPSRFAFGRSSTVGQAAPVSAPTARGRRSAAAAFGLLAAAFAVAVVLQVFLAGLGVFGARGVSLEHATSLDAHRTVGDALGIVAVVLFLLGLLARSPRRVLAATFALALLTEIAQHGLAQAGLHHSWAGGLHAADGALILLLATYVVVGARSAWRDTATTETPISDDDLTVVRLIHAALRRDLARFAAALDGATLEAAGVAGLRCQWSVFASQLHDHHAAEDTLVWPALRQRAGTEADTVLAAMTAEHLAIDPALANVDQVFDTTGDRPADANDLRAAIARVRDLLEAHLTHEETEAIPLVRRHLTSADLDHVAAVQRRQAGLRGAKVFLPWILDDAAPADRDRVLGQLPPPLRRLVRRWQRERHAAITSQLPVNG